MDWGKDKGVGDGDGFAIRADFYAPPSEFDGCFTSFYHLSLDVADGGTITDYLLPEWANLRFFETGSPNAQMGDDHVSGAHFTATGPSCLPCRFEMGSAEAWGIGLLPLGWARFIDADAYDWANSLNDGTGHPVFGKFTALADVLSETGMTREEQRIVIENTMRQLMRPTRDDAKIIRIHAALVEGSFLAVGELADACGMSGRTLERVCRRYFGFTPKRLMRRQRFTRTLSTYLLHKGSHWTDVMDDEYHDQAQFTREFREFMTMNPSEYASLPHPIMSSFMEARARVWGSPAQALDKPKR